MEEEKENNIIDEVLTSTRDESVAEHIAENQDGESITIEELFPKLPSKYGKYIWLLILVFVVLTLAMLFTTYKYIEKKDERLYKEIVDDIEEKFSGYDRLIDVAYSGKDVEYKRGKISARPTRYWQRNNKDDSQETADSIHRFIEESMGRMEKTLGKGYFEKLYKDKLKNWNRDYGDLHHIYDINWQGEQTDGWELCEISKAFNENIKPGYIIEAVKVKWYFPYAVGYIKQEWGYDYLPSVQTAVDEAFDFFTNNENSDFVKDYIPNSVDGVLNTSNEYYILIRDKYPCIRRGSPDEKDDKGYERFDYTYMYNGYYKVFVGCSNYATWTVRHRYDGIEIYERNKLQKKYGIIIGAVFIILLVLLIILKHKSDKRRNEPLYDKMHRLCNPSLYMKPYDKEKVEAATRLYVELNTLDKEDITACMAFADKMSSELGVTLIGTAQLKRLKKRVNPARYINTFDEKKIQLANELYATLSKEVLTCTEYMNVVRRAKELK